MDRPALKNPNLICQRCTEAFVIIDNVVAKQKYSALTTAQKQNWLCPECESHGNILLSLDTDSECQLNYDFAEENALTQEMAQIQEIAPTQNNVSTQENALIQENASTQAIASFQENTPTQENATTLETTSTQENAPTQETAPAQENAPTQETAPAQENAPTQETAPAQENASTQENAPTQESNILITPDQGNTLGNETSNVLTDNDEEMAPNSGIADCDHSCSLHNSAAMRALIRQEMRGTLNAVMNDMLHHPETENIKANLQKIASAMATTCTKLDTLLRRLEKKVDKCTSTRNDQAPTRRTFAVGRPMESESSTNRGADRAEANEPNTMFGYVMKRKHPDGTTTFYWSETGDATFQRPTQTFVFTPIPAARENTDAAVPSTSRASQPTNRTGGRNRRETRRVLRLRRRRQERAIIIAARARAHND